ncbi:MAG TPA: ComEC/Rec2 family competence protein, partial [Terriglobales bacterium]|nr:ComEC/Rec2 family competence protein [Terriglobales bacterium]
MQPSTSNSSLNLFAQQPLFWAATAYAAGIIASSAIWRPMSWWLAAAVVLLGSAIYLTPRRTGYAAALGLAGLGCLGALHYELSASTAPAAPDIARFTDGNEVVVTGHVIRTGLPRSQGATREPSTLEERREVIDIETEAIEGPAGRQEVTFGIRTTVRSKLEARGGANEASAFAYGERVRFPAKVREPRNYGNPGAMDYRGYLGGKGLSALASVGVEKFEKLQGSSGSSFGRWRHGVRQRVAQAMLAAARSDAGWWTLSHEDTTLLLAMVIGEQSLLERTTRTDFQKTGVFHVLVVSGMNVGMLALFVFWTARRLRMKQWLATALTIGSCLSYVMITDLGTPVLRAAIMLSIYLVARLLYRDRFSLNAVGLAAWLLLLYQPTGIFEPSFQLTFLSMVALSGIVQPLLEGSSQPYKQALRGLELTGIDLTLTPALAQYRLDLRLLAKKTSVVMNAPEEAISWAITRSLSAVLGLYELVIVSVVMQLALAVPMTGYFHRLALLGVPTNILVVPLTAVLMPATLIAMLVQLVSSKLALVAWGISALCLHGITFIVQGVAGIGFS